MKVFAVLTLVLAGAGMSLGAMTVRAAATTQPDKVPACCGEKCKKMSGCCTEDEKGKVTCAMGGDCCIKTTQKK